MTRLLKYNEAILEAQDQLLEAEPSVYLIGLGVPDPKGIFGTSTGLQEKYGADRVLDMPVSENGMTGIIIGSAIGGMRPIMSHQRVDFSLLTLDQLINNAAKWHFMFDGQMSVPIVIRLIIGRGWGQGPQHSQVLHSLFANIPGLKVVMPMTAYDAKGLLISSTYDPNPVIFFEHRWLHNTLGEVPKEKYQVPIGKAKVIKEGFDLTVVSASHMTLEVLKAQQYLDGMNIEIIDLRSIKPLDREAILKSVRKTKRLLVVDLGWEFCGLGAEIIALCVENGIEFKSSPQRMSLPEYPQPTSWVLANYYYPSAERIAESISNILKVKLKVNISSIIEAKMKQPQDTPDPSFMGPF